MAHSACNPVVPFVAVAAFVAPIITPPLISSTSLSYVAVAAAEVSGIFAAVICSSKRAIILSAQRPQDVITNLRLFSATIHYCRLGECGQGRNRQCYAIPRKRTSNVPLQLLQQTRRGLPPFYCLQACSLSSQN